MSISLSNGWLSVLLLVVVVVLLFVAQYFLSMRENRWMGLILPAVLVVYSIVLMLQVTIFSFDTIFEVFLQMFVVFLLANIPSFMLVVVYAACRCKVENKPK